MNRDKVNVTLPSMPEFDEYIEEIKELWDSRWITNNGIKHARLEEELKNYLMVNGLALFSNGHLALEYAIAAFDLKGEVITTPFTFVSTTHAITRNGLKPVFCDINPDDFTIDTGRIEDLITENTSAIIPVHVYGNICDIEAIDKVAKKHGLKVICDAAHCFGVTVNGTGVGSFGDASIFSFHATKVFNTVEGGAVTSGDSGIIEKLNCMKNFGITGEETVYIGGNAKLNEFQAAMGILNLRRVESDITKREKLAGRYNKNLNGLKGIRLINYKPGVKNNYAYFPVLFDTNETTRDEVCDKLKENGIIARKYFYPLTSESECYRGMFDADNTPVAKYTAARILTLPLYPDLEIKDVDRICDIIISAVK